MEKKTPAISVVDARKEKSLLAQKICKLLDEFTGQTTITVDDLRLRTEETYGGTPEYLLEIDVVL